MVLVRRTRSGRATRKVAAQTPVKKVVKKVARSARSPRKTQEVEEDVRLNFRFIVSFS